MPLIILLELELLISNNSPDLTDFNPRIPATPSITEMTTPLSGSLLEFIFKKLFLISRNLLNSFDLVSAVLSAEYFF